MRKDKDVLSTAEAVCLLLWFVAGYLAGIMGLTALIGCDQGQNVLCTALILWVVGSAVWTRTTD